MLYPSSRFKNSNSDGVVMGEEGDGDEDRKSRDTVNSEYSMPAISISVVAEGQANPGSFPMYFMIISAGYMFPWTAICSKIEILTELYGKEFFVLMNVYFYISGL
jgi:hypothetical protein